MTSALLTVVLSQAGTAASIDPSIHDFNGNGQIEIGPELNSFNESYQRLKKKEVAETVSGTEVIESKALAAGVSEGKRISSSGIFLGRSLTELDLLSSLDELAPKAGALFSYNHDFNANSDKLVGQGALYLGFLNAADPNDSRNDPDPENFVSLNEGWLLGTAFNFVDDEKPGRAVDQLNFYGGYQFLAAGGPIDANIFKIWAHHDGDTEFKSSVVSASAEWFPYDFTPIPLNVPQNAFGGILRYTPKFLVNGQVGTVLDAGDKRELENKKEIYGIGGEVGLDFWLFTQAISPGGDVDRIPWAHGYVGYRNAWGKLGDEDDYQDLFAAQADVYLGSPNIALTAKYDNGVIPYSGEDVETLTVGLSVLLAP
jgi:hypothetical protein